MRAALGYAKSLAVLMRVWGSALFSAGLLVDVPFDPWQHMAKDMSQCDWGPDAHLQGDGFIVR